MSTNSELFTCFGVHHHWMIGMRVGEWGYLLIFTNERTLSAVESFLKQNILNMIYVGEAGTGFE